MTTELKQHEAPSAKVKKPAGRKPSGSGLRGGTLKARPIMVYPSTPEQRKRIELAAAADGRSLSYFLLQCADSILDSQEKLAS